MYKLDIAVDHKEAAAIERRRNLERQRQSRIFNPRERIIGIDTESIEKQIQEKVEKKETELQRDAAFANEMIRTDKIGQILQQRQEKDRQEISKSLLDYRKEHQRVQDRKEFDLSDPDYKKKDLPTRVSDVDPRLTTSGMQKFAGEDLQYEERKKLQQEQLRDWTRQQKEEKDRIAMEQRKADSLYSNKSIEMDQRAVELSFADAQTRRVLNVAIKEYNKAMAKEKSFQKQQEVTQELDDNYTELKNHINGDLLTENPAVSQSAFGPNRVIPDRWKGMSPSQIAEIQQTQQLQCEEKQRLQEEQKRIEDEWERRRLAEARAAMVKEKQIEREMEELRRQLANENKQLSEEQKAKQRVLDNEVYVNVLDENYYSQFGTSSR